jgi:hypothetical protein
MTKAELLKAIKFLPDDTEIFISGDYAELNSLGWEEVDKVVIERTSSGTVIFCYPNFLVK